MTRSALLFLSAMFLLLGGSTGAPAQTTGPRARSAINKGDITDLLRAREAKAQEAERAGNWEMASNVYRAASYAGKINGQYQKAIDYGNKALEMGERAGSSFLQARAIIQLVLVHSLVRQTAAVKTLLEKGFELVEQIPAGGPRFNVEANMYREMGYHLYMNGDSKRAIEYLSNSLHVREAQLAYLNKLGPRRSDPQRIRIVQGFVIGVLWRLGNAYRGAGLKQDAAKAYERALAVIKEARFDTFIEARIFQELGQLYLEQKDFSRARTNLDKAIELAERFHYAYAVQRASSQMGDLLRETNRPQDAIPYYKKAIQSIESTRSHLESEELRSSFFDDKRRTYGGIILAYLSAKNFAEAFDYNERARSRAFLDLLGSKVQLARGAMLEQERTLQARIASLEAALAAEQEQEEDDEATDREQIRRDLTGARKAYDDFLGKVRKDNKEQASLMNVEPLTLAEVQEQIEPGVSALEYFVVSNQVLLWVVEKDRVRFVRIPLARTELVKKVSALREGLLQIEDREKFTSVSQEIYKLLIEPALAHVRGKELLIIPHDVLHYLPFQALLGADGRYLVENYPINYLSSASLLQFTSEKRRAQGDLSAVLAQAGKVLALGNPDLGDVKMKLEFAEIEAKEIKSLYPQASVYLEKEASEEKAKTLAPANDIIHFASHAELNEDDPLASAVLLAKSDKEDGRLEVREIFAMDLKASLVVLSACETGLGKLSSGDELVGLTRAFIYAGTPSVVASLWNVEDSSTAQLMASFYKNLKTMTKVEALRQAQLSLIRGNVNSDLLTRRGIGGVGKLGETPVAKEPAQESAASSISTSHPYFWAPFILVGEGK